VMRRAVPLVVDILVTALAGIRFHEELAANFFSTVHLRGAGKKWAGGPVAFAVHGERGQHGIFNAAMLAPAVLAEISSNGREHRQQRQYGGDPNRGMTGQPSESAQSSGGDQTGAEKTDADVHVDKRPLRAQRSGVDQHQSRDRTEE